MARDDRHGRASGRKRQITLGWSTAWVLPLWILALVALAFFLRSTRELFVPIVLAMLAAAALAPVVRWLEARRVPRVVGSSLVVVALVALAGWAAWALSDDFDRMATRLPAQIREVQRRVAATSDGGTMARLRQAMEEIQELAASGTPVEGGEPTTTSSSGGRVQPPPTPPASSSGSSSLVSNYLWQGSTGLLNMASYVTVITFLLFFLLLGGPAWRDRLVHLAGDVMSSRRAGAEVLDEVTAQVQRFLLVRLATAIVVGVATWGVLLWFGAPAAGLWGIAAGAFNSVPFFGPLIVSVGLALVGFFAGGFTLAWQLAGSALVITTLEGWLLTPVLLGKAARMNTLAVFLGLLAWSWVWGIWGTLLAVPMLSVLKAVCDHVEPLHPVSSLLEE